VEREELRGLIDEPHSLASAASRLRFSHFDHLAIFSIPRYRAFLDVFRPHHFRRGALIHPRQEGEYGYLVKDGRVRVFLASEDDELTLGYLEKGGFLLSSLAVRLDAAEDSELLVASAEEMAPFRIRFPELVQLNLANLTQLMNLSLGLIEALAFHDVRWRLAGFLVHAADSMGQPVKDGIEVPLRLSTEKIAHLLGTRRQRISTAINELARAGIIDRPRRGVVVIRQVAALRAESAV